MDFFEFHKIASKVLASTRAEVRLMARSQTLPAIQIIIARALLEASRSGEFETFELLMDHLCGPPD